jgi:hypothetical protein
MCQDLNVSPPFTARVFADAVERRWNLQIEMVPIPNGEYTTGWCVVQGAFYTIYYYNGGSVVQRERILFHELSHIVMGHVRGKQPAAMRMSREHIQQEQAVRRLQQEQAVEQVARALVAYGMLGDPPPGNLQPIPPLSAYGQFIDSLLAL